MQAPRHSSFNSHAGGALHAKEEVGWGEGAHQERRSVGERGNGERLWPGRNSGPVSLFSSWRPLTVFRSRDLGVRQRRQLCPYCAQLTLGRASQGLARLGGLLVVFPERDH